MNELFLFYLIVGIIIFEFILERLIGYLNYNNWSLNAPSLLKEIISEEKYQESKKYFIANNKFGIFSETFSFILLLSFLFFNGFYYLDEFSRQFSSNSIIVALIFFGIIFIATDILNTPFSLYHTFVIEEKFGFNKTTVKTFLLDKLKSYLLIIIFGASIISAIIWFYEKTGDLFWLYIWIFITSFSIFISYFYSNLIVPLFNKQTPLEEGELRVAIQNYADSVGFKLSNIYVIDGSKRSTKANAYFTGFGKKKRIVLYDTLIKDHSTEELVSVLAHEIGHYKKKHIIKGLLSGILQTGLTLYILSLFIKFPELTYALGVKTPSFHISIISFGIIYTPLSLISGLVFNYFSRKNEYEADAYCAKTYNANYLSDALKKMSINHLSNLIPHKIYVWFNYSHPPLLDRLNALNKYN